MPSFQHTQLQCIRQDRMAIKNCTSKTYLKDALQDGFIDPAFFAFLCLWRYFKAPKKMILTSEWCAKHPFAGQNTHHRCILSSVKNKSGFQMVWYFENPEFESPLYLLLSCFSKRSRNKWSVRTRWRQRRGTGKPEQDCLFCKYQHN